MSLPKTFTAGERLFASDLNDNFEYTDEIAQKTKEEVQKSVFFLMGA
jgi:hypothetical protein